MVEAGIEYFCSDEGQSFPAASDKTPPGAIATSSTSNSSRVGASTRMALPSRRFSASVPSPTSSVSMPRATKPPKRSSISSGISKIFPRSHPKGHGVVPLILDGENAWEAFPDSGEAFLTSFYRALGRHAGIAALPHRRLFRRPPCTGRDLTSPFRIVDPQRFRYLDRRPRGKQRMGNGSRKHALFSFSAWAEGEVTPEAADKGLVGDLRRRRQRLVLVVRPRTSPSIPDFLFDELFRLHLQNVYRILGIEPPAHLDVPICLPSFTARLLQTATPALPRHLRSN